MNTIKEIFEPFVHATAGIALMFFLVYVSPIFLLEKIVGASRKTKASKHGEALDVKFYLLTATALYVFVYLTTTGFLSASNS